MLPYPHFGSSLRRWGAGRGQLGEGGIGSGWQCGVSMGSLQRNGAAICQTLPQTFFRGLSEFWYHESGSKPSVFKANKTGFSFNYINRRWPTLNWLPTKERVGCAKCMVIVFHLSVGRMASSTWEIWILLGTLSCLVPPGPWLTRWSTFRKTWCVCASLPQVLWP